MTVSRNHVYLYAAIENDLVKCLAAADVIGIDYSHCIGDFQEAWRLTADAKNLVIAVGGAALNALYYNPCSWSNPNASPGGHTPFTLDASGQGVSTVHQDAFVNAGGFTALDSLTLAVMLGYYAVHGNFPHGYAHLPRQETPQSVCVRGASPHVITPQIPSPSAPSKTYVTSPSVGVYASITSENEVTKALQEGWPGIGVTAALGTPQSPYTKVLPGLPDVLVAKGLELANSSAWWLSFWTVSWPASGATFYQAGFDGGAYAAKEIDNYPGSRRPNFVILDPEGYNTPAQTSQQFHDFVRGFAAGVKSTGGNLVPAFYANQSQYHHFSLSQLSLPAFVAIAPIAGNQPTVSGGNVEGYISFYASCPVSPDVRQVEGWGALYNTVQFRDSGIDCAPT